MATTGPEAARDVARRMGVWDEARWRVKQKTRVERAGGDESGTGTHVQAGAAAGECVAGRPVATRWHVVWSVARYPGLAGGDASGSGRSLQYSVPMYTRV